ncbi:MAG TPA: ABC transporter substrate-binding protein, partial [Gemmatimonadales bacterium]
MAGIRIAAVILFIAGVLLGACAAPNAAQQPTPNGTNPLNRGASTPLTGSAATSLPADTPLSASPSAVPSASETTASPAADTPTKGTVTVGFNSFPAYLPLLIMEKRGLLEQRGYQLRLVPFAFEGKNNFAQPELYDKLRQGEWDVLATTLDNFARYADARAGAITTLIDESAGADKIVTRPEITTVNDLKGKRIAVLDGGIGEFFLYYALNIAGLSPADVTVVRKPQVSEAVQAYIAGEVDAVSAWEPDVIAAEKAGGRVLISSADLRVIVDVMITARPALETKAPAVQAFHEAWYQALQLMIDAPEEAGQTIVDWGHPDWTFVEKPGDPQDQLKTIAQATLGANELAFRSPDLIVSRVKEMEQLWSQVGQQPPQVADPTQLVDGQFVLQAAKASQLFSKRPPSNSSFLLTSHIELPALTQQ